MIGRDGFIVTLSRVARTRAALNAYGLCASIARFGQGIMGEPVLGCAQGPKAVAARFICASERAHALGELRGNQGCNRRKARTAKP